MDPGRLAPLQVASTAYLKSCPPQTPFRWRVAELLCDFSAGYAVAGVARGIGFVIVGFGVDDDRGAAVAEQRVGAIAEGYVVVLELQIGFAVRVDREILHVTGVMAFG